MSGEKYSQILLEREKKACQEALDRIRVCTGRIEALREKGQTILAQIPEGVKGSFSGEIQKVKQWLSTSLPQYSKKMNSTDLRKVVEMYERNLREAEEALHLLIEVKERKREKKARELIKALERLLAELSGIEGLLNKWRPGIYGEVADTLHHLAPMIESGEFTSVERTINQTESTLTRLNHEVATLEAQDQQRRYVLESLRKVCEEIGWGEEGEPRLEGENPGNPIVYEVNTYYAGVITFYLTLEHIKIDSPISCENDACYKEFDNLSEKLKRFGVLTAFSRVEAPDDAPRLVRKGEMDLPDEGTSIAGEM